MLLVKRGWQYIGENPGDVKHTIKFYATIEGFNGVEEEFEFSRLLYFVFLNAVYHFVSIWLKKISSILCQFFFLNIFAPGLNRIMILFFIRCLTCLKMYSCKYINLYTNKLTFFTFKIRNHTQKKINAIRENVACWVVLQ